MEINLQQIASTVYERANYDLTLDYSRPLAPKLTEDGSVWLSGLSLSVSQDKVP